MIGGRWRGRKLRFTGDGVRPTGDRLRETLFNWLAPRLPAARCADLFAGSGALGIEALSRGAAGCVFVEADRAVARQIEAHLQALGAASADVLHTDATRLALAEHGPFDIVFLDPPFALWAADDDGAGGSNLCTLLESSGALAPGALIYLEMERGRALPDLPSGWQLKREKTAGQVRYALAERAGNSNTE